MAVLTVVATYVLIVLGGTVRATGSGTACPDWPLCQGQLVPPAETKVMIEYSHRLLASVVGFLILGTLFWGWRTYREHRLFTGGAVAVVLLLAGQVILGGITVKTETAASVVALHLAIALTLLTLLIVIALATFVLESGRTFPAVTGGVGGLARRFWALPISLLGVTFALIIVGAFVSQTGAGLVYPDWPLFNGKLVSAGGRLADLHYAHRMLAAIAGVLVIGFAWQIWDEDRRPLLVVATGLALLLFIAQALVGAANIWLELTTSVRILHLALASAVWAVLVFALAYRHLVPPGHLSIPESHA